MKWVPKEGVLPCLVSQSQRMKQSERPAVQALRGGWTGDTGRGSQASSAPGVGVQVTGQT